MRHFFRGPTRTLVPVLLALGASACQVAKQTVPIPPSPTVAGQPEDYEYVIQAGDELSLKFFYHSTLNEDVTVRPDGRIALQLVGEVAAAGRTAQELTESLRTSYGTRVVDPEVAVLVRSFGGYRIFVAGEVQKPGEHPLIGGTTVLQSIAQAEGLLDTARLTEVLVIRRNPDMTPHVIAVNLKKVFDGTDMRNDIMLRPYDVVFVPRSRIANVNKFVEQYLTSNIPFSFGFRVDLNLQ